jgi:hypothetical protein
VGEYQLPSHFICELRNPKPNQKQKQGLSQKKITHARPNRHDSWKSAYRTFLGAHLLFSLGYWVG